MNDNAPIQGSLEQLGISLETHIEDSVLTAGTAKNVRFHSVRTAHSSKPLGYSFGEVDKFVQEIVIPSLDWYQNTLHKRDKEIHILGGELDQATANVSGLQKQIDTVKYNSNIQQGLQSYQEDKETGALLQKLQELEEENAVLKDGGGTSELNETQVQPYLDAISERDEYIANLTAQYEELYNSHTQLLEEQEASSSVENTSENESTITELNERLENLQGQLTDTQTSLVDRENETETLKNQLASITAELNAAKNAPTDEDVLVRLNSQLEENASQYQELLALYEKDTTKLANDANELQNEIVTLQSALNQASPAEANDTSNDEYIASLTAHVNTITEQYSELEAKYVALYEEHTKLLTEGTSSNESISDDGYTASELQAYIAQITEQYNELLATYNELLEQQANSTNSAEIGQLKVAIESKDAEIARLEFELEEYKEMEADEDPAPTKTLPPLLTEEKKKNNNTPLPPQFGNLPEGIRPEDLA